MTPRQRRAELYERLRTIDAELMQLTRRWHTLDPDAFNHERNRLTGLRETIENQIALLHREEASIQEDEG